VLAGEADAQPKSGDGTVEMVRHLKITRDTAVKARTQAMITLKTLLVNAPQPLRERFIASPADAGCRDQGARSHPRDARACPRPCTDGCAWRFDRHRGRHARRPG
jgi:hypothetical protein